MSAVDKPFLYPNVTSIPGAKSEFDHVFDEALNEKVGQLPTEGKADLSQVKSPLKFSAHAAQRLKDRKITLDQATMVKVNDAIDKADAKGIEDTLILTKDAALIVSVKNRTVITAMDKGSLTGNVFTNIDGAVII